MSTYVHGIGASEALDSSGEIVSIEGLDITSLPYDGTLTWEHKNEKPSDIVGRILKAKKIFSEKDCEDDNELYFWNKCKIPYLYVMGELFDDYKDSAKEVAGMFKYDLDHKNQNERPTMNFSVEGSKISKEGLIVNRSIARKVTITILPCNKQAIAEMVVKKEKSSKDNIDELFKTEPIAIEIFKPNINWDFLKKEDPNEHASKLGIKAFRKNTYGEQGPDQASGSATGGGLGGIGPASAPGMLGGEGLMASEKINKKEKGVHNQSSKDSEGISAVGHELREPIPARHAVRAAHKSTLKEIKEMPKPNLPKSEEMTKDNYGVHFPLDKSHERGKEIGKTRNGHSIFSHGMVGSYTHFNADDHEDAHNAHQDMAQSPTIHSDLARHHSGKARLHMARANSIRDKSKPKVSNKDIATKPQSSPITPPSPKTNKLYDPHLSSSKSKKSEEMNKALTAGSGLAAPNRLAEGSVLGKEKIGKSMENVSMKKDAKNPALAPKDRKVKDLQHKIDSGTYKPDSEKTAEAILKHPSKPLKKSTWLSRAEEQYQNWEKREQFEVFMKSRMPHLTKSEIQVIGQVMLLQKSLTQEKHLKKMFPAYNFQNSYVAKKEKK